MSQKETLLAQCQKETNEYFLIYGQPTEEDMTINDVSRKTIRAMHNDKGACWLGNINLHKENPRPFKLTQWTLETRVYNFQYDFILPKHDPIIETMINERDNAPYNAKNDCASVTEIMDRVTELGGIFLYWA